MTDIFFFVLSTLLFFYSLHQIRFQILRMRCDAVESDVIAGIFCKRFRARMIVWTFFLFTSVLIFLGTIISPSSHPILYIGIWSLSIVFLCSAIVLSLHEILILCLMHHQVGIEEFRNSFREEEDTGTNKPDTKKGS